MSRGQVAMNRVQGMPLMRVPASAGYSLFPIPYSLS
jgi:hypothetical protein